MPKHATTVRKNERLEVRVSNVVKRTLERASSLAGRSLSDFIVSSAFEVAQRTIEEHESMVLGIRDREAFVSALLGPPAPSARARRAARRYRRIFAK